MQIRHLIAALAMLTTGVFVGTAAQQFASADANAGNRPVLIPITPCRLADTRPGDDQVGPRSAPLGAKDTHTIDVAQAGTPCAGKIPADALALSMNVTALDATLPSFLTIWAGGTRPKAASLNPASGAPPTPNAVTTELSVDNKFQVYNEAGSVNIVVDLNGYYVHHNHDDRYVRVPPVGRPQVLNLSSLSFRPTSNVAPFTSTTGALMSNGSYSCYSTGITLPDGARITEATGRFVDEHGTSTGAEVVVGWTQADVGASFERDNIGYHFAAPPASPVAFDIDATVHGPDAIVDNSRRGYYAMVCMGEYLQLVRFDIAFMH